MHNMELKSTWTARSIDNSHGQTRGDKRLDKGSSDGIKTKGLDLKDSSEINLT